MSRFKKATRQQSRLRMALDGPPGAGKTYTGLRCAFALLDLLSEDSKRGTNGRVAVIDSERGSASKYQGKKPGPDETTWDFDVCSLATHSPTEYTEAIREAGRDRYTAVLIDSLSHAWAGKEGALELKDKSGDKNTFTAWKTITPMHNEMVDAILQTPCHVIVTMRSKVDYVLETNEHGKQVPRRVGTAPIQRAGMEYEFDIYGSMDWSNILTLSKSRCDAVNGAVCVKPGLGFMRPIVDWLQDGESMAPVDAGMLKRVRVDDVQLFEILRLAQAAGVGEYELSKEISKRFSVEVLGDLLPGQASELIERLRARVPQQRQVAPVPASKATATNGSNGNGKHGAPSAPIAPAVITPKPLATPAQLDRFAKLQRHYIDAGMQADEWADIFERRGVHGPDELTEAAAEELLGKLRAQLELAEMKEAIASGTRTEGGETDCDGTDGTDSNVGDAYDTHAAAT